MPAWHAIGGNRADHDHVESPDRVKMLDKQIVKA